ncbi:MAG: CysS/YqeB C-terminal domain-containing protein [Acidimicrobiales bacterium]
MTRLLVLMGSGETSPTMSKVHRRLMAQVVETKGSPDPALPGSGHLMQSQPRLGQVGAPSAVMLNTPYGFQENADDISARAVEYFGVSVGHSIVVADYRSSSADVLARETALAAIAAAGYVFSGPGSPSYALTHWTGGPVPELLTAKLHTHGCVTFASAAACTLGTYALPVYEIYKVGQDPHWLPGLDLISQAGFQAVVVPHFNNAEGGNHDTRFCYMGQRRLTLLEEQLPDDVFILGVDEHTAVIFDLDAATATVVGLGSLTVRWPGSTGQFPTGSSLPIGELVRKPHRSAFTGESVDGESVDGESGASVDTPRYREEVGGGQPSSSPLGSAAASPITSSDPGSAGAAVDGPREADQGPLLAGVSACQKTFDQAIATGEGSDALRSLLELDEMLVDWSRDTTQSDHLDRGRAAMRAMLVRLGGLAAAGMTDPATVIGPFVEALLEARDRARGERRFAESDSIRSRLEAAGIIVRDTPEGTAWELA